MQLDLVARLQALAVGLHLLIEPNLGLDGRLR